MLRIMLFPPCFCSFGVFWLGMDQNSRRRMSTEKMDVILKGVVKQFFIEKEVIATLVMDFLYSGLKALEGQTKSKKSRPRSLDPKELPAPLVTVDKDMFVLADDVLLLLERAALEPLPPNSDKGPRNRTKVGFMGYIYIGRNSFYFYFIFSVSEDLLQCPRNLFLFFYANLGCQ